MNPPQKSAGTEVRLEIDSFAIFISY